MSIAISPTTQPLALRVLLRSPQVGLAAATLLWSGNFVVGRALRGQMDPLELNFWRWLLALAVLLPFTAAGLVAQWPLLRRHVGFVLLLALSGVAIPHTCIYIALQTTSALNALLLLNLAPLLIALGARLWFGAPMHRSYWFGMVLSIAGALTLLVRGRPEVVLSLNLGRGDLWMLPAVLAVAAQALLLKRTPPGITQGPLLSASVVAALLLMMPLLWQANLSVPSGGQMLASLAYIGIFASALAFWLWNRAVARVGPGRAAPYLYLMPLYGSLLSFVALGESVQGYQLAGGGLVLLGLWVARPRSVLLTNLTTET